MDIETLKKEAERYLHTARGMLVKDGVYFPIFYAVSEERSLPVGINANTEKEKEEVSEMMAEVADQCEAIFLIMDMYLIEFDEKPKEDPKNIKNDPRSEQALICFLYTRNESFMRQFQYVKDGNGYHFFDLDWNKLEEYSGKFENPFTKK